MQVTVQEKYLCFINVLRRNSKPGKMFGDGAQGGLNPENPDGDNGAEHGEA